MKVNNVQYLLMLLLVQFLVQLDVTPVTRKVYVTRLDAQEDTSTQQDISVSVSFYSSLYFLFLTMLLFAAACKDTV